MLISYHANKKRSPRLPSWQPSLISFNTPIDSGSIIKPCTLKHFHAPILAPGLIWNDAQSLKQHRVGALLFFKVICQISRWHGTNKEKFDSCDRSIDLKFDSNRQFFSPCDLEIWWMTLENNRAHLLYYIKLCASLPPPWRRLCFHRCPLPGFVCLSVCLSASNITENGWTDFHEIFRVGGTWYKEQLGTFSGYSI